MAVMTANPATRDEETPIEEITALMCERRIHRVLKYPYAGLLAGIITRWTFSARSSPAPRAGGVIK